MGGWGGGAFVLAFFGRRQWFPPTTIGRSRTGPSQFHFQGKREFWWSLWVKYSCQLLRSNGNATLDWAHRPSSLSPKVCSYFLCRAVWATSLNSSRYVCRGDGCRGSNNQVASLRQPRCNSNSRQCKKSRVGLAGRRELRRQQSSGKPAAAKMQQQFKTMQKVSGWTG